MIELGLQMGSYFGSSLCAVDLNMDGLSDLLVGAPMFSEVRDEGQVTVYLSKGNVSTIWGSEEIRNGEGICLAIVASTHWIPLEENCILGHVSQRR